MNALLEKPMTEAEVRELFNKIDKNRNGLISIKELKAYLKSNSVQYNKKEVHAFVSKCDDNCDGQINLEELTKILTGIKSTQK
uniref:EF-hand domain-containing protein n=1 Tax=Trichobilharzia regenti TaxID=157069 RepID=A0AA85KA20_TRIRE|nr:unnamed protein product [Trichobilharzia regenti]